MSFEHSSAKLFARQEILEFMYGEDDFMFLDENKNSVAVDT